ncbi:Fic family protein [Candidatus Gracilibacteria bacterium]|nr:Fic family protein [Candidatus Gracilibacteria bacterium]
MTNKIKEIISHNLEIYLEEHLTKIPEDKQDIAKEYFQKDIERITNYFNNSDFLNDNFHLTQDFIKGFHKSLYPEGYIQKSKDNKGVEFVWMIPGEYKKIEIIARGNPNKNIYDKVEDVENKMKKLLNNFNSKIQKNLTEKEKLDFILLFAIDFITIHPFGDGNGRLDGMLLDLLYMKYGLKPLYLLRLYKQNKREFTLILNETRKSRNLKYLYEIIEKYNVN